MYCVFRQDAAMFCERSPVGDAMLDGLNSYKQSYALRNLRPIAFTRKAFDAG